MKQDQKMVHPASCNQYHARIRSDFRCMLAGGFMPLTKIGLASFRLPGGSGLPGSPVEVGLLGFGGAEVVSLDFVVQGGAVDPEDFGGLGDVPLAVLEDLVDVGALHFLQGVGSGLAGGAEQEGEVVSSELAAFGQDDGSLDGVFKLPDVAGPVVGFQQLQGLLLNGCDGLVGFLAEPEIGRASCRERV